MQSLNEIARWWAETVWGDRLAEIILDPNIPKIYDYHTISTPIRDLMLEVNEHAKSDKHRVKTNLNERIQILELAWNGESLSESVIQLINGGYQIGIEDTEESPLSGTRRIGFSLAKYNGRVKIENFQEGIYVVGNVIELPIDYK